MIIDGGFRGVAEAKFVNVLNEFGIQPSDYKPKIDALGI